MRRTVLLALLCSLAFPPERARGEALVDDRQGVASLADQLKTGLHVKAPRDVHFVDRVAELVREGRLPRQLVDSTYLWAVRRGKKHPFPAFEHVIRLQAGKLGVPLE